MGCMLRLLIALTIGCLGITLGVKQKSQSRHAKSNYLELSETHRTGVEGAMLQVNCTAHVASPLASLKWTSRHEGLTRFKQVSSNTSVLMWIPSLSRSDAGRYICVLVMEDGTEVTEEYQLLVKRKERKSAACKITQFKCEKSKHCIFLRYRCDGYNDCSDSTVQDDSDEDCEINPCFEKFRCNNTRCVDRSSLCDHVDNCGDRSDEGPLANCFGKSISTAQPSSEEGQFGWLKITVSTIIACTVGLVILISFIVIMVFRVKMKRLREQRIARALEQMYQHGRSGGEGTSTGHGDEGLSDQHPFLSSSSSQPHYGNIIVNVNNGVQYMPGYDYPVFMDSPPPYSEFGSGDSGDSNAPPPPYSTIDRRRPSQRDRDNTVSTAGDPPITTTQNVSQSTVQMFLGGGRGSDRTDTLHREGADLPINNSNNIGGHNSVNSRHSEVRPSVRGESSGINSGTLPGININSSFLQSLLGSHLQNPSSDNSNCAPAIATSDGGVSDSSRESGGERSSRGHIQSETQLQNGGIGSAGPIVNVAHFSTAPNRFKLGPLPSLASQSTQTPKHKSHSSRHANTVPKSHEPRQGRSAPIVISNEISSGFNGPHEDLSLADSPVSSGIVPVSRESASLPLSAAVGGATASNTIEAAGADHALAAHDSSQSVSGMEDFGDTTDNNQTCLASASSIMPSYNEHGDFDSANENEELPLLDGSTSENVLIPSEEGTCLLRKHKGRSSSELAAGEQRAESDILMPLTPSRTSNPNVASNALFTEVSRRDERTKPKPGHLSVQKGQILLHTNEGVLASHTEGAVGAGAFPSTSEPNSDQPRISGELVVKDGNIMLQSPSKPEKNFGQAFRNNSNAHISDGMAYSQYNSQDSHPSSLTSFPPTNCNGVPDAGSEPLSSITQSPSSNGSTRSKETVDAAEKKQDTDASNRFSGELNIKDGCLVLEAPKHTPLSRVLSHLQGAYAAEQQEGVITDDPSETCVEAVVNTKRPAGVVSRPQLPKFASDVVLPFKNQQQ